MNYFYNGKEVNNFTILKLIGKGSYASVYKVKRKENNNIYAMKVMDGNKLNRKDKIGLINEINILSSNKNPNLLKFYEVFIENNFFHVIMEYADNKDLKSFIDYRKSRNAPLSYKSINKFFYQLCLGVKYLHDHNVIHRDLKPANIMVTKNFDLKIGDFGISKVFTENNKFAVTQIGSPIYMSPEVMGECKYCHKTDIWALGCILYELITFKPAFNANSLNELYKMIRVANYDRRKISNTMYSRLIDKMLLVNQNNRPDINYIIENIPNLENTPNDLNKTNNKILPALIIPKNKYQWNDILPKPAYSPVQSVLKNNLSEPFIENKLEVPVIRSKSQLDNYNDKKEDINEINQIVYKNNLPRVNFYKRRHNNRYNNIPLYRNNNRNNNISLYSNNNNNRNNIMYNRVDKNNLPKIINHADKYLNKVNEKKKSIFKNKMRYGENYISPYNQHLIKKDINLVYLKYNKNNYVSEYKDKFRYNF